MRTITRTSTNRLVSGSRQECLPRGGKGDVRVVDNRRMRLFSSRARQALGSFIASITGVMKSALAAAPRPAYASNPCLQPALAHRCWHRMPAAQQMPAARHRAVSQG